MTAFQPSAMCGAVASGRLQTQQAQKLAALPSRTVTVGLEGKARNMLNVPNAVGDSRTVPRGSELGGQLFTTPEDTAERWTEHWQHEFAGNRDALSCSPTAKPNFFHISPPCQRCLRLVRFLASGILKVPRERLSSSCCALHSTLFHVNPRFYLLTRILKSSWRTSVDIERRTR